MTSKEIDASVIKNVKYVGESWVVLVELSNNLYPLRIYGPSDITDDLLSDLIYRKLLDTDIIKTVEPTTFIVKDTLKGLTPKVKK
jgi:hypothetical protein